MKTTEMCSEAQKIMSCEAGTPSVEERLASIIRQLDMTILPQIREIPGVRLSAQVIKGHLNDC